VIPELAAEGHVTTLVLKEIQTEGTVFDVHIRISIEAATNKRRAEAKRAWHSLTPGLDGGKSTRRSPGRAKGPEEAG
jgi:hypothetical protein